MTIQDRLQVAILFVNVVVAMLLAWTGWSTYRSAKAALAAAQATQRATLAELVSELMAEYGSPEMHNYGVKLVSFASVAREEGKFPPKIPHGVEARDPDEVQLDHARRYFEQFHIRVHALHKLGMISDDTARTIISEYDVRVLLKEHLISMLMRDQGFKQSRFFQTIPLWERLYDAKLLSE
jgi:hypothetical protein